MDITGSLSHPQNTGIALADTGSEHSWIVHQYTYDEVIGDGPSL